jgi:hypothetical protein
MRYLFFRTCTLIYSMLESSLLEGGSNIGVVGKWATPTFLCVWTQLPASSLDCMENMKYEERIYPGF